MLRLKRYQLPLLQHNCDGAELVACNFGSVSRSFIGIEIRVSDICHCYAGFIEFVMLLTLQSNSSSRGIFLCKPKLATNLVLGHHAVSADRSLEESLHYIT